MLIRTGVAVIFTGIPQEIDEMEMSYSLNTQVSKTVSYYGSS